MGATLRQILVLLALATPALAQEPRPSQPNNESVGLAAWEKIYQVFSHPRCANCHVGQDNEPMWSGPEYGPKPRRHAMYISGGTAEKKDQPRTGAAYIPCGACHMRHNAHLPHGPPGAPPNKPGDIWWQLAPLELEWFGKSSAEICKQVRDPASNGGFTITGDERPLTSTGEERSLTHHIANEHLVQWGWAPGLARPESAPGSERACSEPGRGSGPDGVCRERPPYSAAEVVELLKQWAAADAPCP